MPNSSKVKLDVSWIPISQLIAASYNPRKISKEQLEALKRSITEFGIVEPIVVNDDMTVIGGHQRLEAMLALGRTEAPCVFVNIPKDKERVLNLALNRIHGEWDEIKLGEMIDSLKDMPDMLELTGFESAELDEIIDGFEGTATQESQDEVTAMPQKPQAKFGQIYELGQHRLICGDSANPDHVKKLMNGFFADMIFTDPPYGVAIAEKNRFLNAFQKSGKNLKDIENDNLGSTDDLFKFLLSVFSNVKDLLNPSCSIYVTAPQGGDLGLMMMMMKDSGFPVRHVLIWKKNYSTFSMRRLDYDYQHEPILYTWNKKHKFYGGGTFRTSVWEFDKPMQNKLHPTMKPVELIENAILNSSKRGEIVLDLFGGVGSTLIAAEKTGRRCFMMKIDPDYCDVIRERYKNFTEANEKQKAIA